MLITFTIGHRRIGGEEEDGKSWKNEVTDFMRIKNMGEDTAEDKEIWRFGMDRRLLGVLV